jgi:hypothetical protein
VSANGLYVVGNGPATGKSAVALGLHDPGRIGARPALPRVTTPANCVATSDRARENERLFFKLPLDRIVIHPTFWYRWVTPWLNGYPEANVAPAPPLDEFVPFDPTRYVELIDLPRRTLSICARRGRKGSGR